MQQQEILQYLKRFFLATGCKTTVKDTTLFTTLTIDLDKKIMNRPFYWHYLEKIGGNPSYTTLALTINKDNIEDELVHFGSPRLKQIFDVTSELGGYIRLYEQSPNQFTEIPLLPWLMLNGTISYICDHKREIMYSYGINLLTGELVDDFYSKVTKLNLTPKIPDYCFTLSPLIKISSGMNRIQEYIKQTISKENHNWAKEAKNRWENDLTLLEKFYQGIDDLPKSYEIEKQALNNQYEPRIQVNILNGGIFYLKK